MEPQKIPVKGRKDDSSACKIFRKENQKVGHGIYVTCLQALERSGLVQSIKS